MKEMIKVAAVQMDIKDMNPKANLDHMLELIEKIVSDDKVNLIVFPELSNSGYVKSMDVSFASEYIRIAEKIPGKFTRALGEKARRHKIYIVTGMLEAHPNIPVTIYNSGLLFDPSGEVSGVYRKIHLPGEEKHYFCKGSQVEVYSTELGNIGIIVCADSSFPELPRVLALKGAEIICCCYNVPKRIGKEFLRERISHIAACRAIENMCFYIGCNRAGNDEGGSYIGHSAIASPTGELLARSQLETEDILRATLTGDILTETRISKGYFLTREPKCYGLISEL